MRKHQRYFPVESPGDGGGDGDDAAPLMPHFITVANGAVDPDAVRRGNESVLKARYEDAKFFYEADTRKTLADFKPELSGITFQTAGPAFLPTCLLTCCTCPPPFAAA